MAWCRENINLPNVHFVGSSSPVLDLAVLSLCDHSVIDYGTYGLWGALLAGGDTILPRVAVTKHRHYADALGWTVLEGF